MHLYRELSLAIFLCSELIPEDFDSRQVISVWHLEDENR